MRARCDGLGGAGEARRERHDALTEEARAKRGQAAKSRRLAQVVQRSVTAQGASPAAVAQLQQLDASIRALLTAADAAERAAEEALHPSAATEVALLGGKGK